jgi:hypothetical protein
MYRTAVEWFEGQKMTLHTCAGCAQNKQKLKKMITFMNDKLDVNTPLAVRASELSIRKMLFQARW